MKTIEITEALISLVPEAAFTINGDQVYENIQWLSTGHTIPSKDQVLEETARLQAESDSMEYRRVRARQYPTINDQLDMLWHAMDIGALPRVDAFYSAIKAVKDANPK